MAAAIALCVTFGTVAPAAPSGASTGAALAPQIGRRGAVLAVGGAVASAFLPDACGAKDALFDRDRGTNKGALIQKDFYYDYAVVPPRKLDIKELANAKEPAYNAWGSCVDNACTYVPLQQRYNGYSKYADDVKVGSEQFAALRKAIEQGSWETVSAAVSGTVAEGKQRPSPIAAALIKCILMGNALLISENSASQRDALLARFYVNEAGYSLKELARAAAAADADAARAAWSLGADSWNSYFTVVNRAIVDKVGTKFDLIAV